MKSFHVINRDVIELSFIRPYLVLGIWFLHHFPVCVCGSFWASFTCSPAFYVVNSRDPFHLVLLSWSLTCVCLHSCWLFCFPFFFSLDLSFFSFSHETLNPCVSSSIIPHSLSDLPQIFCLPTSQSVGGRFILGEVPFLRWATGWVVYQERNLVGASDLGAKAARGLREKLQQKRIYCTGRPLPWQSNSISSLRGLMVRCRDESAPRAPASRLPLLLSESW